MDLLSGGDNLKRVEKKARHLNTFHRVQHGWQTANMLQICIALRWICSYWIVVCNACVKLYYVRARMYLICSNDYISEKHCCDSTESYRIIVKNRNRLSLLFSSSNLKSELEMVAEMPPLAFIVRQEFMHFAAKMSKSTKQLHQSKCSAHFNNIHKDATNILHNEVCLLSCTLGRFLGFCRWRYHTSSGSNVWIIFNDNNDNDDDDGDGKETHRKALCSGITW